MIETGAFESGAASAGFAAEIAGWVATGAPAGGAFAGDAAAEGGGAGGACVGAAVGAAGDAGAATLGAACGAGAWAKPNVGSAISTTNVRGTCPKAFTRRASNMNSVLALSLPARVRANLRGKAPRVNLRREIFARLMTSSVFLPSAQPFYSQRIGKSSRIIRESL